MRGSCGPEERRALTSSSCSLLRDSSAHLLSSPWMRRAYSLSCSSLGGRVPQAEVNVVTLVKDSFSPLDKAMSHTTTHLDTHNVHSDCSMNPLRSVLNNNPTNCCNVLTKAMRLW